MKFIEKIKSNIKKIADFDDKTERLALALSVGIGIGLSPFYGLHTLMSAAAGFLFKLNKIAVFGAPWIVNPLTMIPIYGFGTAIGAWILGYKHLNFYVSEEGGSFMTLLKSGLPLFKSFLLGNMVLSLLCGLLSYYVFYYVITRIREQKRRSLKIQ
jgi:uncharacterized protein